MLETAVRRLLYGILGFFALIILISNSPFFIVNPGQVAVSFSRVTGATKAHSQGMHFRVPLLTGVVKFDVKTSRFDITAESASKDLQAVNVEVVVNYHLLYDKVNELFVKVGADYQQKVIEPALNESVKAAAAQFPVEEIITNRHELKSIIEKSLKERLAQYYIELESLNLVDIDFSEQFNHVVEQKQVEEQKIKTAEYQRRQAEEYKKKTILEAEADAEKQRLLKQSITDDIVALEWIKKWNGQLPVTMLGDKTSVLFTPNKE